MPLPDLYEQLKRVQKVNRPTNNSKIITIIKMIIIIRQFGNSKVKTQVSLDFNHLKLVKFTKLDRCHTAA